MAERNYIPGVCNIGEAEIARRLQFGWIGVAVTVILATILFVTRVPPAWRLVLFLPAAGGAVGLLQGYMRFCADFGMRGVFNFGSDVGKTDTVERAEFRRKDRRKAVAIVILTVVIGAAVCAGSLLAG